MAGATGTVRFGANRVSPQSLHCLLESACGSTSAELCSRSWLLCAFVPGKAATKSSCALWAFMYGSSVIHSCSCSDCPCCCFNTVSSTVACCRLAASCSFWHALRVSWSYLGVAAASAAAGRSHYAYESPELRLKPLGQLALVCAA